jgi:alcohol dehydrogenase (cytochrome c)
MEKMMMKIFFTLAIFLLSGLPANAQTNQDLIANGKTGSTDEVLTYGMGYHQNRYSPLTQINKEYGKEVELSLELRDGK